MEIPHSVKNSRLCLSSGLWIKQTIDHLKALAVLHMQRTSCSSSLQSEYKTWKTLYVAVNQAQDTSTVGTPAGFALVAFVAVH